MQNLVVGGNTSYDDISLWLKLLKCEPIIPIGFKYIGVGKSHFGAYRLSEVKFICKKQTDDHQFIFPHYLLATKIYCYHNASRNTHFKDLS